MLSIFRTNQFLVNLLLLFYAAALHLSVFIDPSSSWEAPKHGVLADWVYHWLGSTGTLADISAIVLLFSQAVILNLFFVDNRITREYTLFPGLFYILVASALPDFLHLSPILLANMFYLLAYRELFATYRKPMAAKAIFNAGFWIGLASLFYFSFVIFLFWGFLTLNIMRAFRVRERVMMVIGLMVPYLLMATYFFYIGQLDEWLRQHFVSNISWLDLQSITSPHAIPQLTFFGLLLLAILLSYGSYAYRQTIDVQKKINLLYWGLLFGGLSVTLQANVTIDHTAIMAVPMGMLLSLTFVHLSSRWAEAWHLLLLVIILFFQYQHYFLPLT